MQRRKVLVLGGGLLAIGGVVPRVAAASVEVDVYPADLEVGDGYQPIGVDIRATPEEEVVVRIDLGPLAETGVDVSNAAFDRARSDIVGGAIEAAEVAEGEMSLTFAMGDSDALRSQLILKGLDTTDGAHDVEVRYPVAIGAEDAYDRESASFRLVDPDEFEPTVRVVPTDIVVDGDHQHLEMMIEHLPVGADRVTLDIGIEALADHDVDVGDAGIDAVELVGTLIEGVPIEASNHDPLRLTLEPVDGVVEGTVRLAGLGTENAEGASDIRYPISLWVGDPPSDPTLDDASRPFAIVEEHAGDGTPNEPTPEPDDPTEAAPMPGFTAPGALAAAGALAVAWRRMRKSDR